MATKFVEDADDLELLDFDPFGQAFRENPEQFHAWMFENSPAFVDMEGVPSAVVASFAQCQTVLRDFKTFSSLKPKGLPGMERVDFFNGLPVMNYSDPPDHTRRRRVVNPAFTPKRVERILVDAEATVDSLLDQVGGTFDAMGDFCKPFGIATQLDHFLAIPKEDQAIFLRYTKEMVELDKLRPGDPKPQAYLDAWRDGADFCQRQLVLAREGKSDNLIGAIAAGTDGGVIDQDEMMAMMIVLLIGGISTVAGAAALAMLNMARYPEVAERVRNDPAAAALVLEESLRLDPPISLLMRFCTTASELGGKLVRKGMPMYVMIASACHDPAKFPDPYKFDIDRENLKDHIAFGYGIHTCIGNAITRAVGPMLIRKVAQRFPNLRLADEPDAVTWETSTGRARHVAKVKLAV